MNSCVFDLETIANPVIIPFLPEVEANKNMKDPVKIANDIAKKKTAQVEKMGLDPTQSLICCASFLDLETDEMKSFMLSPELDERTLLTDVWEHLYDYKRFISFNGNSFDVPMLKFHSLINKVYPSVILSQKKYQIENHVDVRMILGNWDNNAKGTLDYYSKIILGPAAGGKTEGVDGSMVQGMWNDGKYDEIKKYCERDVRILGAVYRRLIGYYI